MKQEKVKALLEEASAISTFSSNEKTREQRIWGLDERVNQIYEELEGATFKKEDSDDPNENRDIAIRTVLFWLFYDAISHRPDYLPKLFPVFALLCGDSTDGIIAESIDWFLVDLESKDRKNFLGNREFVLDMFFTAKEEQKIYQENKNFYKLKITNADFSSQYFWRRTLTIRFNLVCENKTIQELKTSVENIGFTYTFIPFWFLNRQKSIEKNMKNLRKYLELRISDLIAV